MSNVTADTALQEAAGHVQARRSADAFAAAQRALRARPGDPQALLIMGIARLNEGKPVDAEAYLRQALVRAPESPDVLCNLGLALAARGDHARAIQQFERAIRCNPAHVESWANAAGVLVDLGRLEEAVACIGRAYQSAPGRTDVLKELGRMLLLQGRVAESLQCMQRAASLEPGNPLPRMQALLCLNYLADVPAETAYQSHASFGEWFAQAASSGLPAMTNTKDPTRRVRVGLVSPDFRSHSCASFVAPLLDHLPRQDFEVCCYSQVDRGDAVTERFRAASDRWIVTARQTGVQVAEQCRQDEVDILIDLAGHTFGSRLDIFVQRAAPVQMTYLGYPNTTGLRTIDWRIVDWQTDPAGAEALSVERLARLDGCFVCFEPRRELRQAGPVARAPGGPPTFAVASGLVKMSLASVRAWSQILAQAPGSRLLLTSQFLADPGTWMRVQAAFKDAGAPEGAVQALAYESDFGRHMERHAQIDLVLDTFPYNSTTTTCEQLWMGVPVLTWEGDRHASRVGASLLRAVGHEDLIATSAEDYVGRALDLIQSPDRLGEIRRGLRDRVASSVLVDGPGFGRRFGAVLRDAWGQWCASAG